MSWLEDLEFNVARTGHGRFRELCADDHPDRELHRAAQAPMRAALERESVRTPAPARVAEPVRERIRLLSAGAQCPHRRPGAAACGCASKARCAKYNKDVALEECGACVAAGLDS